jgi:DNA-directed RNA polymerase subunit beta
MNFIAINPIQMISIATSLIPFLEHNDGNRALMGSNMQRQAVPILKANFPIVGTGLESNIIANSNYVIQAKYSGLITYIDGKQIVIYSSKNFIVNYLLKPLYKLKYFNKNINKNNKNDLKIINKYYINNNYDLQNNENKFIKIKNNLFNFNKFIYLNILLNNKKQENNLKNKLLFKLFSFVSKKNSSIFAFIFCRYKINEKIFFNNIKNKKCFKINNFSLINTKIICKIFNFTFQNSSLYTFEIIYFYSNKIVFNKKISKIKKFLSQNNLFLLKQFENKNIIKYYSKFIIDNSPLTNYLIINILNIFNIKQNKNLKKLKPYKIILPINFNIVLNKINLLHQFNFINIKLNKINNIFKNFNYINKKLYFFNCFTIIKNYNLFKSRQLKIKNYYKNKNFLYYVYFNYINNFNFKFKNFYTLKKWNFILKKKNYKKQLINLKYKCDPFFRSNQDTYLVHRPIVKIGQWIQRGDILADNSTSVQGELSIGQNILIGYLPWEGYNFEDAVLINQRLVYDDIFTSLHIERYETEIRETQFGSEEITPKPNEKNLLNFLDNNGIVKLGTWVKEGDILVGKNSPIGKKKLSAYEKLLYDIIGKSIPKKKDTSLRVPLGIKGRVIHIEIIEKEVIFNLNKKDFIKLNKEKKLNKNFFIYKFLKQNKNCFNINDKSLKIKKFNFYFNKQVYLINKNKKLKTKIKNNFYLKNFNNFYYKNNQKKIIKLSFNIKTFLIKKKKYFRKRKKILLFPIFIILKKKLNLKIKYLKIFHNSFILNNLKKNDFFNNNILYFLKNTNINFFTTYLYKIIFKNKLKNNINEFVSISKILGWFKNKKSINITKKIENNNIKLKKPLKIIIYIAEKRKIQIGDKIAGRHGNKGIVSNILPCEDMPYLPNGTPLDLVLNPLGVPSRMNVGQIFESLLGLAGTYLNQCYKIQPFDEMYGSEASQSLVYSKLYEARIKTGQYWLFNPNYPGKIKLFDGRTGNCFEQPNTVGKAYILKLIHQVDEKIHARSTGPYSLITQQPLRGRSKQGGQRVGEMEVWALEGFGASYILQELLTIKSDDIDGRNNLTKSILNNKSMQCGTPESFKVLIRELQALCLDISIYKSRLSGKSEKININF